MKKDRDQYRLADILIAAILGGVLALSVSLLWGQLQLLLFPGDICVAGLIAGACFGIFAGRRATRLLEDVMAASSNKTDRW
ncbi:MAG: hypothetical protein ACK5A1_18980 [Planctomyces sp.]|nr:hypothetical protein [Planctomyces sp.]